MDPFRLFRSCGSDGVMVADTSSCVIIAADGESSSCVVIGDASCCGTVGGASCCGTAGGASCCGTAGGSSSSSCGTAGGGCAPCCREVFLRFRLRFTSRPSLLILLR